MDHPRKYLKKWDNAWNSLIKLYPEKYNTILQIIGDSSIFCTTQYIIDTSRMLVEKWRNERQDRKLYIVSIGEKVGSEQWMYLVNRNLLPPHQLITSYDCDESRFLVDNIIEEDSEILFIDDFMLSGTNIIGQFENLFYNFRDITQRKHISFIMPVVTAESLTLINEIINSYDNMTCNVKTYYDYKMEKINYDDDEQLTHDLGFLINPDSESLNYPFFTEYKIPNQFGSFPTLYNRIYTVDRSFMDDVKEIWNKLLIGIKKPRHMIDGKQYEKYCITPQIWLGPKKLATDTDFLRNNQINTIINCAVDLPLSTKFNGEQYKLPMVDTTSPEEERNFLLLVPIAVNILRQQIIKNRNVLVHCVMGQNRSALVVATYLVLYNHNSIDDVIKFFVSLGNYSFEERHRSVLTNIVSMMINTV